MTDLYVVLDIGCLECSNPTELIAVTNLDGVKALGATLRSDLNDHMDWGGQAMLVAFPIGLTEQGTEPPGSCAGCGAIDFQPCPGGLNKYGLFEQGCPEPRWDNQRVTTPSLRET